MSAAQTLPREERLRTMAGLRGTPALALSAWRGTSGRRYVVGIHQASAVDAEELVEAVVIAVRRDGVGNDDGIAKRVRVECCADLTAARAFVDGQPKTVTEFHVHRLATDAVERAAVLADLQPEKRR